jgi:hypothetical protein
MIDVYRLYQLALIVTLAIPSSAFANKVQKLNISPLEGFTEAPTVIVYSTKGEKWNAVDTSAAVTFKVNLNAECKYEGKGNKAYEGDLLVEGFDIVGDTDPADFLIPHSDTAEATFRYNNGAGQPTKPIEICATELTKRLSENKDLSKYHILSKGFTVKYPGAFEVKYRMYCHATGLGRGALDSDTTLVNARITCSASDLAESKIPKPPPPRPKVKTAKLVPLVKTVKFEADPSTYQGNCPVGIKFNGSITATSSGKVKYQYVSHDNRKSSVFTLQFAKAGTQPTRLWSRTLSKPDAGSKIAAAPNGTSWDHQGWYRIDILDPKPTGSIKANYKVACKAPTPSRTLKQQ